MKEKQYWQMRVSCTHSMCEKECVKTNYKYVWVVLIKKWGFRRQLRTPNARTKIGAVAWDASFSKGFQTLGEIVFFLTGQGCTGFGFLGDWNLTATSGRLTFLLDWTGGGCVRFGGGECLLSYASATVPRVQWPNPLLLLLLLLSLHRLRPDPQEHPCHLEVVSTVWWFWSTLDWWVWFWHWRPSRAG